jgi:simple sugar transport system permease protein
MLALEPRTDSTVWTSLRSIVIALAFTALVSVLVMLAMSDQPGKALWQLLTFPWQGRRMEVQFGLVLQQTAYLATIAIGLAVGFKANVWNIGAEGQFAMGSVGAYLGYLLMGSPTTAWALIFILIAGVIGGCLWALIPAALRVTSNTNELLTSLMLVYVASHLLTYLCIGPWKGDPKAGQAETFPMPDSVRPSTLIAGTEFHTGLIVLFAAFAVLGAVLLFTLLGYRLRVAQYTPRAERFAGFSSKNTVWISFLVSGAMAGLAGAVYLTAETGKLIQAENYLENFGFAAIVIAFLGRLHPVGILLAAFLISYVNVGASFVQASLGVDDSVAELIEVTALFAFLSTAMLDQYRVVWQRSATTTKQKVAG